jgi:Ca2+-binding RTX toxin-like protein
MLLLLTALPSLLGLSYVFDFWGNDDDDEAEQQNVSGTEAYTGTEGADNLLGDDADNIISGAAGNDIINGADGNDQLDGGTGKDTLIGGLGDDVLDGGFQDDTLNGGDGYDTLLGNGGDDTIYAGDGDDQAEGGYGDDRVFLGDGNDTYGTAGLGDGNDGTAGLNTLEAALEEAETFADLSNAAGALYRQEGDDFIRGGAGNDIIKDTLGSNTVHGDEGADRIITLDIGDTGTADTVYGGYGADSILVDDGDTVSGGANADDIVILRFESEDDDVVTVTDFAPEEDSLELIWTGGALVADPALEYTDENGGVMLSYDGVDLAFLANVNSGQVTGANITLYTAEFT